MCIKAKKCGFLHCYAVAKVFWVVVSMLLGGCSQDPIKFEVLFKWVLDKLYNKVNSTVQILLMSDLANTMNKRNTCALFDTFLATLRDKRNQSSGAKSAESDVSIIEYKILSARSRLEKCHRSALLQDKMKDVFSLEILMVKLYSSIFYIRLLRRSKCVLEE